LAVRFYQKFYVLLETVKAESIEHDVSALVEITKIQDEAVKGKTRAEITNNLVKN